jgi:hypothetical protein
MWSVIHNLCMRLWIIDCETVEPRLEDGP